MTLDNGPYDDLPAEVEALRERTATAFVAAHAAVSEATAQRARVTLAALGVGHTTRSLAVMIGVGHNTVARWARDAR